MRQKAGLGILIAISFISLLSCSRNISEPFTPPDNYNTPATPINLSATIGDRAVYLNWSVSDTAGIESYRIYRADSLAGAYTLDGETSATSYAITNLRNGQEAFFKVSSVNHSNFEGYLSEAVSAIPNLFGVLIDGGSLYTNNRNITLQLVAPVNTLFMQIANDSSFAGSIWENYQISRVWELESADGIKTIYVKFRDSNDQTTSGYVFDSITLDTRAVADSITVSPNGSIFEGGDRIHVRLFAGETGGVANAAIGNNLAQFALYDDGSRGDAVSGDGIYESDFTIPNNLDIENAYVYGDFTDRAGNSAPQAQSARRISIRRAPDAVTIVSITAPVGAYSQLQLQWTGSEDDDFAQYRIYRATSAGVDSSDYLVALVTSSGTVSYTDTGLTQNTVYYYRIYVVDNTYLWNGSNEVHATTASDSPPGPALLFPIVVEPDNYFDVNLTWSHNPIDDLESFRIYSWRTDTGRNDSVLVAVYTDPSSLSHIDHPTFTPGLDTLNYWYIVHTYDLGGHHSPSNIVRAHLADTAPPTVSGAVIPESDSITLSWIDPQITDFGYYRLLRDTLSTPNQAGVIYLGSNHETTTFHDGNLSEGHTYYYWLEVYDRRDHSSRTLLGSARW
jgi:hypothetical protein